MSRNKSVTEYAPSRIKQAIAGLGSASKEQVAGVVCRTLHIEERPRRADATDGMAVALCHYYASTNPIERALGGERVKGLGGERRARKAGSVSWEKFLRENPDKVVK